MFTTMYFYVHKDPNGLYHIQNAVGPYLGQHHVHTKESFEEWREKVPAEQIEMMDDGLCDCGLSAGQVRSHTGTVREP